MRLSFFAILACVVLSGCLSTPGGLTSSTLPISAKDSYTIIAENVSGGNAQLRILGLPLYPLNAYDALQSTKEKYGADGLINVTVENEMYSLTLIPFITYHKVLINGDAIKFKRGKL
ncbi:MAG TPA: hypothetical protein PK821_06825 [Victivallales bacterium]|nr:hypothetical protein [Victivallales bacterium]